MPKDKDIWNKYESRIDILISNKNTQNKLSDTNLTDHERYTLNHKLDTIKTIRI